MQIKKKWLEHNLHGPTPWPLLDTYLACVVLPLEKKIARSKVVKQLQTILFSGESSLRQIRFDGPPSHHRHCQSERYSNWSFDLGGLGNGLEFWSSDVGSNLGTFGVCGRTFVRRKLDQQKSKSAILPFRSFAAQVKKNSPCLVIT